MITPLAPSPVASVNRLKNRPLSRPTDRRSVPPAANPARLSEVPVAVRLEGFLPRPRARTSETILTFNAISVEAPCIDPDGVFIFVQSRGLPM